MMGREQKIHEEAAELWRTLYSEQPPQDADGSKILDMIMRDLPDATYARLASPHLRPAAIVFPKPPTRT